MPIITKVKSRGRILITPIIHDNEAIIDSLKNESIDFFYNNNFFLSDTGFLYFITAHLFENKIKKIIDNRIKTNIEDQLKIHGLQNEGIENYVVDSIYKLTKHIKEIIKSEKNMIHPTVVMKKEYYLASREKKIITEKESHQNHVFLYNIAFIVGIHSNEVRLYNFNIIIHRKKTYNKKDDNYNFIIFDNEFIYKKDIKDINDIMYIPRQYIFGNYSNKNISVDEITRFLTKNLLDIIVKRLMQRTTRDIFTGKKSKISYLEAEYVNYCFHFAYNIAYSILEEIAFYLKIDKTRNPYETIIDDQRIKEWLQYESRVFKKSIHHLHHGTLSFIQINF